MHKDVKEGPKRGGQLTLGTPLTMITTGNKTEERFEDLDEILARYAEPLAEKVQQVVTHRCRLPPAGPTHSATQSVLLIVTGSCDPCLQEVQGGHLGGHQGAPPQRRGGDARRCRLLPLRRVPAPRLLLHWKCAAHSQQNSPPRVLLHLPRRLLLQAQGALLSAEDLAVDRCNQVRAAPMPGLLACRFTRIWRGCWQSTSATQWGPRGRCLRLR